ncbi:hydantoinase/oxoprolinase family protein [Planctomycetaceae bacterium SH139]
MTDKQERILGIDIGGANLKAADQQGHCQCQYFPLWKHPQDLAAGLQKLAEQFNNVDRFAITMTGELADCFRNRAIGVRHIVDQCQQAFGERCEYYTVDGQFVSAAVASADDAAIAASNWHAMASLAATWSNGDGLLIDIGSTTTDLIPFAGGRVATTSRSDQQRLMRGELIYAGVGRTPICAVVDELPYRGQLTPVMNEVFAVTDDCAILTGITPADAEDCESCDGRPRTRAEAANRMARMIGLDHREVSIEDATEMAIYVWERLQAQWIVAAGVLSSPAATWFLVGHGQQLLPIPADRSCCDLSQALGPEISRAGPAYAVACLSALQRDPQALRSPLQSPPQS